MPTDLGSRQQFHLLVTRPEIASLYFGVLVYKMDVLLLKIKVNLCKCSVGAKVIAV